MDTIAVHRTFLAMRRDEHWAARVKKIPGRYNIAQVTSRAVRDGGVGSREGN